MRQERTAIDGDPRYEPIKGFERLILKTREHPFAGAQVGIDEAAALSRVLKTDFVLERITVVEDPAISRSWAPGARRSSEEISIRPGGRRMIPETWVSRIARRRLSGDWVQPHPRASVIQELNAHFLKRRQDLRKGGGSRTHLAAERFHPPDCADGERRPHSLGMAIIRHGSPAAYC